MGQRAHPIEVEVVIVGYHDPRICKDAPIGFAIKAGHKVTVHYLDIIDDLNLPEIFAFTAKRLPTIISEKCKNGGVGGKSLHKHLLSTCFSTLGSFRCWEPVDESIAPEDFDAFVGSYRELVGRQLSNYVESLDNYQESCQPSWKRMPEFTRVPQMPSLVPQR